MNTILLIAVICAIMLTVVFFIVLRSKRRREAERTKGQVRTGPTKLTLSIPAPVSHQGLPGHGPGSLPPAQTSHHRRTEETGDGSGYIRPTRPKKDKRKQKGTGGPDEDGDILDDRTPSVPLERSPSDTVAQPVPPETDADPFQVPGIKTPLEAEATDGTHLKGPFPKVGQTDNGPGVSEVDDEDVESLDEVDELDEVEEADQEDIEEWST